MSGKEESPKNVASEEPVELDEVDVEATAAEGRRRPRAHRYRIRIDRQYYVVKYPQLTGRDILIEAGKDCPEHWLLSQKLHGGKVVSIGLDEVVDLRAPGVERFMTLPKDQTEG